MACAGTPALQGGSPQSTSKAAIEASRGMLISWVLLRESCAEITEWQQLPGDDHDEMKCKDRVDSRMDEKNVPWHLLKKAVEGICETASVGYTESSSSAVFA